MKNEEVIIRKYKLSDKDIDEELMQQDQKYHINGNPDLFSGTKLL